MMLMLVLVERTVSFTAVDASWGKRSEKVCTCKYTCTVYTLFSSVASLSGNRAKLNDEIGDDYR